MFFLICLLKCRVKEKQLVSNAPHTLQLHNVNEVSSFKVANHSVQ